MWLQSDGGWGRDAHKAQLSRLGPPKPGFSGNVARPGVAGHLFSTSSLRQGTQTFGYKAPKTAQAEASRPFGAVAQNWHGLTSAPFSQLKSPPPHPAVPAQMHCGGA